ncbi:2OG-Fe(II) oxygenase [Myxococcus stipitatus DSM 14675]|uniref:2-oxoglutarate-dependent ethylene/succinate-forming enzyme n=1 Tax=Myxococcus stipitatus (strain DSM 14675 / JCM 12634 / Mx s8) TaxID=1278073 RepID=L7UH38_MYXSD|nr:2-oxoglutarate and iron-dependent oxygenase domain-containing protein [Myxococcus stipitatus]AGC47200.1 2OG-Fe(II) oxygenase [Myxococcus stipitatus DSM 14675]
MIELETFQLPQSVSGREADIALGLTMVRAWRRDGIFQVRMSPAQAEKSQRAFELSRHFFRQSLETKARCVSDLTYSGYIASGQELTASEADLSEVFTVCRDVPLTDPRVQSKWPCHGPGPWPDESWRQGMQAHAEELGSVGERLLRLIALGLGLDIDALTTLTHDGWHHMRVLRFPARSPTTTRGIGAHTDYGLLVIAAQDDVGGLYVRPPVEGEKRPRNWLPHESSAGMYEHDEPWTYVKPVPGVLTVFPGDILQFLTRGYLLSTPHKVVLNTRERFALAYFHEPQFEACVRPLSAPTRDEYIHYGTHFTNMFMRSYPDRVTTQRILDESRLTTLSWLRQEAVLRTAPLEAVPLQRAAG